MTSNKTGGEGYKVEDAAAARTVARDLQLLGEGLGKVPEWVKETPATEASFGRATESSSAGATCMGAIEQLMASLGHAQKYIQATAANLDAAMSTYEGIEDEAASGFKSQERGMA